jgi:hypothetical protein
MLRFPNMLSWPEREEVAMSALIFFTRAKRVLRAGGFFHILTLSDVTIPAVPRSGSCSLAHRTADVVMVCSGRIVIIHSSGVPSDNSNEDARDGALHFSVSSSDLRSPGACWQAVFHELLST